MVAVLFVCTGNICRSPTAEGVMRKLVAERGHEGRIVIDSAGTHGYHEGEPPDARSIEAAARRGIDLSSQRARRIRDDDFADFDLILAMDSGHARILTRQTPRGSDARIAMFLDYAPHLGATDVPDPYYGGGGGFELVLDMAEAAAAGLIEAIEQEYMLD
ncbi:MAG: low molecular weight phosphotyrosine protein phosphatase [Alphaproteobacteria bacterium]|nr:low molecular weight phosphotyrosine protein phosphatase [Alphaproteobacteria bacterium]